MVRNDRKSLLPDLIYLAIIFLIISLYFLPLFIPELKTFVTPDVYLSDFLNMNYSLKYILSQSLKHNLFPYWHWYIGNGFPLIGESQIGAFYLPNIVLLKFFPFPLSINIGYVFTFFIGSLGAYLFFNKLIKNKFISFLGSFIYAFSAPMFTQITHYNLLQAISLIPLVFYFLESFIHSSPGKKKVFLSTVIIFLLAQQFFAGYAMISFITFLSIFIYLVLSPTYHHHIKQAFFYPLVIGIALIPLTAIQLIPLVKFALLSVRKIGIGNLTTAKSSLSLEMLLTYLKFDFFGSFTKGTVSTANFFRLTNLLWEGNLSIGLLPFLVVIFGLPFLYKKRKIKFFTFLYFISLIFSLGQYSPINFVYSLPPFSFFRTPFRFVILMDFFLVTLFVLIGQHFVFWIKSKKQSFYLKTGFYLLIVLTIIRTGLTAQKHHPLAPTNHLPPAKMANFLDKYSPQEKNNFSIYSFGNELVWYQTMAYKNWADPSIYHFFLNDLGPYLNVFYRLPSANIFFASYFAPNRQYYFASQIKRTLISSLKKATGIGTNFAPTADYRLFIKNIYHHPIKIDQKSLNLLKIKGVKFFITPINYLSNDQFKKIAQIRTNYQDNLYYLRIYQIKDPYPRFYPLKKVYYLNTEDDLDRFLSTSWKTKINFSFQKNKRLITTNTNNCSVHMDSLTSTEITLTTNCHRGAYLGSTFSYFPGIKAFTKNHQSLKIEPINLNQIAVQVPKGKTKIKIIYQPQWLLFSQAITVVSFVCLLVVMIKAFI